MVNKVLISRSAKKDLKKVPSYIAVKLQAWVNDIEIQGIKKTQIEFVSIEEVHKHGY